MAAASSSGNETNHIYIHTHLPWISQSTLLRTSRRIGRRFLGSPDEHKVRTWHYVQMDPMPSEYCTGVGIDASSRVLSSAQLPEYVALQGLPCSLRESGLPLTPVIRRDFLLHTLHIIRASVALARVAQA